MRQEMQERVTSERADREGDEELEQVVVGDLTGERDDGHTQQTHSTYH